MRISDWSSDVCSSDLGEGLALWFGADFNRANALLRKAGDGDANLPEAGAAFRQVLALLIAQRRPSFYLRGGRAELEALTASYLRLMADAGVISMSLRDAALRAPLNFADDAPPPRSPATRRLGNKCVRTSRS